ncbi:MAG: hypothetical protein WA954_10240 [Parerythrobacter sp.]
MTEEPDSLMVRYLRRIDERTARLETAMEDLRLEMRGVKSHQSGFMQDQLVQDSGIATRRDRMDRVERRLDIRDGIE